jgi:hypothetical protein
MGGGKVRGVLGVDVQGRWLRQWGYKGYWGQMRGDMQGGGDRRPGKGGAQQAVKI